MLNISRTNLCGLSVPPCATVHGDDLATLDMAWVFPWITVSYVYHFKSILVPAHMKK